MSLHCHPGTLIRILLAAVLLRAGLAERHEDHQDSALATEKLQPTEEEFQPTDEQIEKDTNFAKRLEERKVLQRRSDAADAYDVIVFLERQNPRFESLNTGDPPGNRLVELSNVDENALIFVIGDLHGFMNQLLFVMGRIYDVLKNDHTPLTKYLVCSPNIYYIFTGDYVDRGDRNVETATLVLLYRMLCPYTASSQGGVVLLRGNHDDMEFTKKNRWPFYADLQGLEGRRLEYPGHLISKFGRAWNTLPYTATINQKVLLVHGGLPRSLDVEGLADYNGLKQLLADPSEADLMQLTWNDPGTHGWQASERDGGAHPPSIFTFGQDVMDRFMKRTGIQLLVRGHQECPNGYEVPLRSVLTLHTAARMKAYASGGALAQLTLKDLEKPVVAWHMCDAQPGQKCDETSRIEGKAIVQLAHVQPASFLQERQSSGPSLTVDSLRDLLDAAPEEDCNSMTPDERQDVAREAVDLFKDLEASGDEDLALRTEIKINELGEAYALAKDPKQELEEACRALLLGKGLDKLLESKGAVAANDTSVLRGEVEMKRDLVKHAKSELQHVVGSRRRGSI